MQHNSDTTKVLTSIISLPHNQVVSQIEEVSNRLRRRLQYEASRAKLAREELAQLGGAYLRYCELEKELRERDARLEKLWSLLAEDPETQPDIVDKTLDVSLSSKDLREQTPLWEYLEVILQEYGELREIELLDVFGTLSFSTNAAAIASSLKTHPRVFQIRTDGRKKFISLREGGQPSHAVEDSGSGATTTGPQKRKRPARKAGRTLKRG